MGADVSADAERLATAGLEWLLSSASTSDDGLVRTGRPDDDEVDPTLYSGAAGIVVALLEAHRHLDDDRWADAAVRGASAVAAAPDGGPSSLYFGMSGTAFALHEVGTALNRPDLVSAATRSREVVRSRFDGERWADQFELLGGNAGIALGALAAGDVDLAVLAVEPYTRTVEVTPHGVHWEVRQGVPARFHHISHGTLGIVLALASVGAAVGRDDLVELALSGAADVVARDVAGPDGFLVPHSDPQHKPEIVERYSYGWCHGPAGDAQVFRLLHRLTGDPAWTALVDRCWHTVTTSGLPERLRPGFWDNNGRCCGTAGVLALAVDLAAEGRTDLTFARVLVDDLAARATVDPAGARWSNHEHRVTPSELSPRRGWAMGNAGIVRELLRHVRLTDGRDPAYAVAWPDHPAV